MQFSRLFQLGICVASLVLPTFAQQTEAEPAAVTASTARNARSSILGPGDRLTIAAPDIEELDRRQLRVQTDGTVSVPLIGSVKAAGLTADEVAARINELLRPQFRDPHISFTQIEVKSKTVTVLGSVNAPGVIPVDGRKRLLEVISAAGGLKPEAGTQLTIERKVSAGTFPDGIRAINGGTFFTTHVSVNDLMEGKDLKDNIVLLPGDIVTVPKGKLVYVLGEVRRAGGFVLSDSDTSSVLRALSLAEGMRPTAKASDARILRNDGTGQRIEEHLDLSKLLKGKEEDIVLQADDILYIPGSTVKKILTRGADAGIQTGTGVAIYRH